jgi:hypothetical protein
MAARAVILFGLCEFYFSSYLGFPYLELEISSKHYALSIGFRM